VRLKITKTFVDFSAERGNILNKIVKRLILAFLYGLV